jgi:mRNA interferase HigB
MHPQAKIPLMVWYRIAGARKWTSIVEVRRDFPHADLVGNRTVFNIGGNDFRLVADIWYPGQVVYVKAVLTHAEYDKGRWK